MGLIGHGGGQGTLDRDSSACEHINFVTRTEIQHFLSIIKPVQPFPNPFPLQCRSVGWLVSNSTCLFPAEKLVCFYLKTLERNITYKSLYPSTNFKNVDTGKEERKFYLTLNIQHLIRLTLPLPGLPKFHLPHKHSSTIPSLPNHPQST